MKIAVGICHWLLGAFWIWFLGANVVAAASGDWFVLNLKVVLISVFELAVVVLLIFPRSRPWAAFLSCSFLMAAVIYHASALGSAAGMPCSCMGAIKTTHIQMLPVACLGLFLAVIPMILNPRPSPLAISRPSPWFGLCRRTGPPR